MDCWESASLACHEDQIKFRTALGMTLGPLGYFASSSRLLDENESQLSLPSPRVKLDAKVKTGPPQEFLE